MPSDVYCPTCQPTLAHEWPVSSPPGRCRAAFYRTKRFFGLNASDDPLHATISHQTSPKTVGVEVLWPHDNGAQSITGHSHRGIQLPAPGKGRQGHLRAGNGGKELLEAVEGGASGSGRAARAASAAIVRECDGGMHFEMHVARDPLIGGGKADAVGGGGAACGGAACGGAACGGAACSTLRDALSFKGSELGDSLTFGDGEASRSLCDTFFLIDGKVFFTFLATQCRLCPTPSSSAQCFHLWFWWWTQTGYPQVCEEEIGVVTNLYWNEVYVSFVIMSLMFLTDIAS
ncbi:hypothetical protein B0T21DRAFT_345335 [Apiosordaria backusii]|uniref:Uncharacterized protein n=1 Tax=Apiosordaria backusii TaxID=314023 RepID=A0AA40K4D8_9PEZI|nr:hypothetical protein B0T21DRAFT_345335 [Apiosordaria backusii]